MKRVEEINITNEAKEIIKRGVDERIKKILRDCGDHMQCTTKTIKSQAQSGEIKLILDVGTTSKGE
jgi:hypothetical protein